MRESAADCIVRPEVRIQPPVRVRSAPRPFGRRWCHGPGDISVAVWGYTYRVNGGADLWLPMSRLPSLTNAVMVTGGVGHSLAPRSDGTVAAWGDNTYGQARVPVGLTNVVSIAAGYWHNLASKSDGSVVARDAGASTNSSDINGLEVGQSIVPAGLTNLVGIAAGGFVTLAQRADGSVVSWGPYGQFGEHDVPPDLANPVALAIGGNHTLALTPSRDLIAWGAGKTVGRSTGADWGQSRIPASATNVAAIGAGYMHSLAILGDVPPWIPAPPPDRTILHGQASVLRVAATGSAPLRCQWRCNGTDIESATNELWRIPATRFEHAGRYPVVIQNPVGQVVSREFQLRGVPIILNPQPRDKVVLPGGTATFTAVAVGPGHLTYQWRFQGDDLPGATNAQYAVTNARRQDAGLYSVRVRSDLGTVQSEGTRRR